MHAMLGDIDWYQLKYLCDDADDSDGTLFKNLVVMTVLQVTSLHAPPKRLDGKAHQNKAYRKIST